MKASPRATSPVARYLDHHGSQDFESRERQVDNILACLSLFRTIDPSVRMVEIGTGMGWFPIIAKMRNLNVRGIERSPQLIQAARELGRTRGVEPDIQLGNIEVENLGDSRYDVAICSSVFEHVEHWQAGLTNVFNALRPGGLLFFESTNKFSLVSGEYPLWCYGWLPDKLRYSLRVVMQGPEIMAMGIDFNQFTYPLLRRTFREIGFTKCYDRVCLAQPNRIKSPIKRALLVAAKKSATVRAVVLTFIESTTFVCVK